jgi:hypothetical protein
MTAMRVTRAARRCWDALRRTARETARGFWKAIDDALEDW